jgi:hypothetical protein
MARATKASREINQMMSRLQAAGELKGFNGCYKAQRYIAR